MHIDFTQLSANAIYFNVIQTLVPRPIAWVLSENENQSFNLAPFSYFNAVSSNPPLLMISVGKKPDGSHKDTRVNIEKRRDFVVHIPHEGLLNEMNDSSATLPAGVSELDKLGLETTEMVGSRLPRIEKARIAFACECYEIHEIGSTPQSMILGRIKSLYIDDSVANLDAKNRLKVDTAKLQPVARLGASEYMTAGTVITKGRPS
ncbi:MAG: flavin reductase family protein [Motiliproteus sp.]|nr:flavin reductase family protein [Motiliproteus sp.]MCW9051780.1 flavin reductase family protein [Motiliproteus sp.]